MVEMWHPKLGVSIKVDDGISFSNFFTPIDIQIVLKVGPLSFNTHVLLLHIIKEEEIPKQIPLFKVPFWVQIYNLPTYISSLIVGQNIVNYLVEFLDYDEKNMSCFWYSYKWLRVLLYVRLPLQRTIKILKQGGKAKEVIFKYDKLGYFCYLCTILSHTTDSCENFFQDKG